MGVRDPDLYYIRFALQMSSSNGISTMAISGTCGYITRCSFFPVSSPAFTEIKIDPKVKHRICAQQFFACVFMWRLMMQKNQNWGKTFIAFLPKCQWNNSQSTRSYCIAVGSVNCKPKNWNSFWIAEMTRPLSISLVHPPNINPLINNN